MERIAHRGAKRELPENTLAAFERAFDLGANAIELDVHATSDGVIVVHHDPTLSSGIARLAKRAIADLDWDAVRRVDLGRGAGIPRLDDVLAMVPARATVYVEIKGVNIEERVASAIAAHRGQCAVHSFDHAAVARMRTIAPDIPRGILFEHAIPDISAAMRAVDARDAWPAWRAIDETLVDQVHSIGGRVIAWTVNDRSEAQRLFAMGVDGLCTDDIRLLDGL